MCNSSCTTRNEFSHSGQAGDGRWLPMTSVAVVFGDVLLHKDFSGPQLRY
ncbi:hypothetical protein [Mycobacterium haemophilum]